MVTVERMTGYLSPREAAARLGVAEATVRFWANSGKVSVLMTPHGRLFQESEIDRIAAERAKKEATNG